MATTTKAAARKPKKPAKPAEKAVTKKVPATRTAAKRATPKVSPLRGTSVEAYVAKLGSPHAEIVRALVALFARTAPHAPAVIKWARPVFESGGPVSWIQAATRHVTFGFWRGAELDDPEGLLGGGDRMKHMKLTAAAQVTEKSLAPLIRQAVKLNAIHGDPTKRA
jgi:hypothetical protein